MPSQIVLILGAGVNVGKSLVQKFSSQGFKVAIASRNPRPDIVSLANTSVTADFSQPSSIKSIFEKVKSELGVPNVVIYNASSGAPNKSPYSISLETFEKDLAINVSSVFAAAQEAITGFETLPKDTIKAFIFTGNGLNVTPMPILFSGGIGKSASAHLIQASSILYKDDGYRFYYADERKADGSVAGGAIDGDAHAEFYYELSQKKEQGPWQATFVKGTGYVDFN